jgi:hypothetical protein
MNANKKGTNMSSTNLFKTKFVHQMNQNVI